VREIQQHLGEIWCRKNHQIGSYDSRGYETGSKKRIAAEFSSENEGIRETIAANLDGVLKAGLLTELTITGAKLAQSGGGLRSTSLFDVRVPHIETVDVAAELVRLKR
jgi:hypothetical protein